MPNSFRTLDMILTAVPIAGGVYRDCPQKTKAAGAAFVEI
jgi:hypothetical protein